MKQAKGKNASFARGMSSTPMSAARKKTIRSGPLMPLLFILALVWIGGMGYLAYKFFIAREGGPNGGVTVEYPGGGAGDAQSQETDLAEQLPPIQPLDTPEVTALPALSWSEADARGYSNPVSSSSNLAPAISGTVLGDRVRLRSEPNTDSNVIRHFNKGAKVEITQRYASAREEYPWYLIRANGRTGWMYGQYVGEITPQIE
ncbi:MAG: SH3 domain-containing protein [Synergistaceae bacterium]|nr:SH3 domain-containing protein [Synergistaceae bacterium]